MIYDSSVVSFAQLLKVRPRRTEYTADGWVSIPTKERRDPPSHLSMCVSLSMLGQTFWGRHDPTQLNGQGNDLGTQYRVPHTRPMQLKGG